MARILVLRSGVDAELELAAEKILEADRRAYYRDHGRAPGRGMSTQLVVYGILSQDQWEMRLERDVFNHSGLAQRDLFAGMYRRCWADWPVRPTRANLYSQACDPWSMRIYEDFGYDVKKLPSIYRQFVEGGTHYDYDIMLPHRDPLLPRRNRRIWIKTTRSI